MHRTLGLAAVVILAVPVAGLLVAGLAALAAYSEGRKDAEFLEKMRRIQLRMTEREVEEIMGRQGVDAGQIPERHSCIQEMTREKVIFLRSIPGLEPKRSHDKSWPGKARSCRVIFDDRGHVMSVKDLSPIGRAGPLERLLYSMKRLIP